jgi:putative flippase GtrA
MREIVAYLFFGALTTLVNTAVYFAASWGLSMSAWLSTVVAFVFAVTFAFFTNKFLVFRDGGREKARRQAWQFFLARVATMAVAAGALALFVDMMEWNEIAVYVAVQVFVVVANYIVGKFYIFKSTPE